MELWGTLRQSYTKRAGNFLLGRTVPSCNIKGLISCIAREHETDNFRVLRILHLNGGFETTLEEMRNAKSWIRNEAYLLKLLEDKEGVVKFYGLFRDTVVDDDGSLFARLFLVLECFSFHDFDPRYTHLITLYEYMQIRGHISEEEAIRLFLGSLKILASVHDTNVVHRNLSLSSFVLDTRTNKLVLANFGLGNLLLHENSLVQNQPGPALYFSPDIVKARPFLGKPSDMWSMGVLFFGLLFSEFPLLSSHLDDLYKKIAEISYAIPIGSSVSVKSINVIKGIFKADPTQRLTCKQAFDELISQPILNDQDLRVVPSLRDCKDGECQRDKIVMTIEHQEPTPLKVPELERILLPDLFN